MELTKLRNTVVNLLHQHTKRPVVMLKQISDKPLTADKKQVDYPFLAYTVTSSFIKDRQMGTIDEKIVDSTNPRFEKDIMQSLYLQPKCSFSFTAYAKDSQEAKQLAQMAWDYLMHTGYFDLSASDIVVVDCTGVQNRDIFEVDTYERREGFDVKFRYVHTIQRRLETIEKYKINKI